MVAHQALEGGAVNTPIMPPQVVGSRFIHGQSVHDVIGHGLVHDRKNVRTGVMQGVV